MEQLNHFDEHFKGSKDKHFGVGWMFSESTFQDFTFNGKENWLLINMFQYVHPRILVW